MKWMYFNKIASFDSWNIHVFWIYFNKNLHSSTSHIICWCSSKNTDTISGLREDYVITISFAYQFLFASINRVEHNIHDWRPKWDILLIFTYTIHNFRFFLVCSFALLDFMGRWLETFDIIICLLFNQSQTVDDVPIDLVLTQTWIHFRWRRKKCNRPKGSNMRMKMIAFPIWTTVWERCKKNYYLSSIQAPHDCFLLF